MTVLKWIGMLTMLCDHAGFLFDLPSLRIIGRMTFPIFAFMTAYGFEKTKDRYMYIRRIMVMALVAQLPFTFMYILAGDYHPTDAAVFACCSGIIGAGLSGWGVSMMARRGWGRRLVQRVDRMSDMALLTGFIAVRMFFPMTNVLFTLSSALLILLAAESKRMSLLEKFLTCSGILIGLCVFCDYSFFGVGLVVLLYLFRPGGFLRGTDYELARYGRYIVLVVWSLSMFVFFSSMNELFGMLAGALCVFWYMELTQRRPASVRTRKICYWFYPAHLVALDAAALLLRTILR